MINPNAILEINTENLVQNFKKISKYSKKTFTGAVIKANAYGLGDLEVIKYYIKLDAEIFF